MKTKKFRSILALAVVTASVATSLSPAQAFTLDDLVNAVKRGYESTPSSNSSQQPSNNESPQAGGFNNDTPQPQTTPPQNNNSGSSSPTPRQNNYSAPSSPNPQPTEVSYTLLARCVKVNGSDTTRIGQYDSDSMISVGKRAARAFAKIQVSDYSPAQRTCAIMRHPTSEKLISAFAIPDNSTLANVRVSISVDGQERINKIIGRGQARKYTVDLTGANSYAITLQPINFNSGDSLYGDVYMLPVRQPN